MTVTRTANQKKLPIGFVLCAGTFGLVYPQTNPKKTKIIKYDHWNIDSP